MDRRDLCPCAWRNVFETLKSNERSQWHSYSLVERLYPPVVDQASGWHHFHAPLREELSLKLEANDLLAKFVKACHDKHFHQLSYQNF